MTQQYIPVTWQDETTSQQGTLINAERLNQMQQAHHFADGFEEVDAVPTADPSVAYHKMVYCTADSTFYRWDGTEWTKDIDDETKALLQQEIARATAAEGGLAQDIADETARATARENALDGAITAEETAREQADTALGTRITNETSARETADTALGNRITAEATARADADTALGGRIDTEQARAEAAEQANAQAIANTYTKAEADTLLAGKASTSTVQTLDTRVGALETGLADTYNKSQTDALLASKADTATTYTKTETDALLAGYVTLNTAQTITAVKTLSKSKDVLPATIKLNDYAVGDTANAYLDGVLDENNAWVRTESVGTDTGGARGYYIKTVSVNVSGTAYNIQRRWWLTAADGLTESYLDPIKSAWRNVVTDDILDSYAPMVRTTGSQYVGGLKTCYGINIKRNTPGLDFIDTNDASNTITPETLMQTLLPFRANDESLNFLMQFIHNSDGAKWVQMTCFAENGAVHAYRICGVDASGNQMNPQWLN